MSPARPRILSAVPHSIMYLGRSSYGPADLSESVPDVTKGMCASSVCELLGILPIYSFFIRAERAL